MDEPIEKPTSGDSLGAELRRQRELRGITLKEIADGTKISRRYLEALESNAHEILPAPVFTRGFVREFARYIGLDPEEMADRYNELSRAGDPDEDGDALSQSQPLPFIRIDRNLVVFALLLVAFSVVVWWVWSYMGARGTADPDVAVVSNTIEPAVAPPDPDQLADEPPAAEPPEPERLELGVTVVEDTWVILHADGQVATNEVLRAGDVRTFSAENALRFEVVGNAGGIELTLNGEHIPSLGARGRVVRDLVFDWKVLEQLQETR
jgi:cytoskeletal protein RodZ